MADDSESVVCYRCELRVTGRCDNPFCPIRDNNPPIDDEDHPVD